MVFGRRLDEFYVIQAYCMISFCVLQLSFVDKEFNFVSVPIIRSLECMSVMLTTSPLRIKVSLHNTKDDTVKEQSIYIAIFQL